MGGAEQKAWEGVGLRKWHVTKGWGIVWEAHTVFYTVYVHGMNIMIVW